MQTTADEVTKAHFLPSHEVSGHTMKQPKKAPAWRIETQFELT